METVINGTFALKKKDEDELYETSIRMLKEIFSHKQNEFSKTLAFTCLK